MIGKSFFIDRITYVYNQTRAVSTDYTYNSRNQLAEEETKGRKTRYHYDANGNLLKKSGAAAEESYKYDVYNRLVSCQSDREGKKETYTYDAEGVRRSKTTSQGKEEKETLFISDTSGELSRTLAESDGKGELLATYGWGNTLVSQTREGKTSTYLYDGQGNVRGLLDEKGSLTDTYAYNAYGELTAKTGETENHFLYTGEYYDGVSGLYYLRARYMNPETGTFTSMDTWQGNLYEPVTLHKYLYANANPVKYKDPSGNMGSLQECNLVSAISAELYKNQNVVMGMAVLNGIGKSVMTGLCGGDAGDMTTAFLEGVAEGAAMGMLFCAVAAVLATSMLTVMMAHTAASSVVSIVLAIYSVSEGDYLNALVYGAVAVAGIIGVYKWYRMSFKIDIIGSKGKISVADNKNYETQPQRLVQQGKTAAIGKMKDLNAPGKIVYGEFKVADYLPDQGSPKANWKQNSGILRSVIREGVPIKDVSEYPMQNAGFLGAERNLLEMMGWAYDDGYWYLP